MTHFLLTVFQVQETASFSPLFFVIALLTLILLSVIGLFREGAFLNVMALLGLMMLTLYSAPDFMPLYDLPTLTLLIVFIVLNAVTLVRKVS